MRSHDGFAGLQVDVDVAEDRSEHVVVEVMRRQRVVTECSASIAVLDLCPSGAVNDVSVPVHELRPSNSPTVSSSDIEGAPATGADPAVTERSPPPPAPVRIDLVFASGSGLAVIGIIEPRTAEAEGERGLHWGTGPGRRQRRSTLRLVSGQDTAAA